MIKRRLASLVTLLAVAALVAIPATAYFQRGTPPKQEQPRQPDKGPAKGPAKETPRPKQDGKQPPDKDGPERRDRMKQRDKEVDRILNRKR